MIVLRNSTNTASKVVQIVSLIRQTFHTLRTILLSNFADVKSYSVVVFFRDLEVFRFKSVSECTNQSTNLATNSSTRRPTASANNCTNTRGSLRNCIQNIRTIFIESTNSRRE